MIVCKYIQMTTLTILVISTFVSVTRVLIKARRHYYYAYNTYKWQFMSSAACIQICLMSSILIKLFELLKLNKGICNFKTGECLFTETTFGSFVKLITCNAPGLAFVCLNSPSDFIIDFNKYPEAIGTPSVIQYPGHHIFEEHNFLQYKNI